MNQLLRLVTISLSFALVIGLPACKHDQKIVTPLRAANSPTDDDPDLKLASEIQLERTNSDCRGCDFHSIALRRTGGDIFADVFVLDTNLDTGKQREGKLSAYYYNHLLQLLKSEGFMEMDDQYAMLWFDALNVKMTVSIGNRRKTIRTSNEGQVPLQLWGLYMAFDGAVARTKWNDSR
jgi:hypothetical protein